MRRKSHLSRLLIHVGAWSLIPNEFASVVRDVALLLGTAHLHVGLLHF